MQHDTARITETIDSVTMRVAEDGTLEVGGVKLNTITTLALRLFLMRIDVDNILNSREIAAESRHHTIG